MALSVPVPFGRISVGFAWNYGAPKRLQIGEVASCMYRRIKKSCTLMALHWCACVEALAEGLTRRERCLASAVSCCCSVWPGSHRRSGHRRGERKEPSASPAALWPQSRRSVTAITDVAPSPMDTLCRLVTWIPRLFPFLTGGEKSFEIPYERPSEVPCPLKSQCLDNIIYRKTQW